MPISEFYEEAPEELLLSVKRCEVPSPEAVKRMGGRDDEGPSSVWWYGDRSVCCLHAPERQVPEVSSKPSQLASYKHKGKFGKCI